MLLSQAKESENCQGPSVSVHFLFNRVMECTIRDL